MPEKIATEDKIVFDAALGISRKVFAGQPIPADLVDAYEAADEKPKPAKRKPADK